MHLHGGHQCNCESKVEFRIAIWIGQRSGHVPSFGMIWFVARAREYSADFHISYKQREYWTFPGLMAANVSCQAS